MKQKISRRDFIGKSALSVGAMGITVKDLKNPPSADKLSLGIPKRKLGRTGSLVSCIGFGGGGRFYRDVGLESIAEKLLDYAVKLGITYFDSARAYGGGKTEKRYGRYLTPKYRDKIFLNSKSQMRDYDGVMKDIEISLKTLKTDNLDLYCMHGIDTMEQVDTLLSPSGGYKAFLKIRDEGVAKNIGFSFHKWNEASKRAFENFDIDVVMCPLNASRQSGNEKYLLPLAQERNVSVIAIKTTGASALIGNIPGRDLIRYALSLPISVVNIGIEGFGTLESCVEIANERMISSEERDEIHRKLAFDPKIHRLPYFQG